MLGVVERESDISADVLLVVSSMRRPRPNERRDLAACSPSSASSSAKGLLRGDAGSGATTAGVSVETVAAGFK